jgi:hypothetical protein
VHRFFEVSLGIAIVLVVTALWPERVSGGDKLLRFTVAHKEGSNKDCRSSD